MEKSIAGVLSPVTEKAVQCWVRYAHLPDEWHQIGARKLEYSSIGKFKAALKSSNNVNPMDYPERYAEIMWVEVEKTVTKKVITE